jgi:hydrogenase expression/formation protein HypC
MGLPTFESGTDTAFSLGRRQLTCSPKRTRFSSPCSNPVVTRIMSDHEEFHMCLAVPMEVVEISGNMATVQVGDVQRRACLDLVDTFPELGDYLIVHAGYAIHRIDPEEAKKTLEYFKEILEYEVSG